MHVFLACPRTIFQNSIEGTTAKQLSAAIHRIIEGFRGPILLSVAEGRTVGDFERTTQIISAHPTFDEENKSKYLFHYQPNLSFTSDKIAEITSRFIVKQFRNYVQYYLGSGYLEPSTTGFILQAVFHDLFISYKSSSGPLNLTVRELGLSKHDSFTMDVSPMVNSVVDFASNQYADGLDKLVLKENVYYYPNNKNFPFIDGFIIKNGILTLFQVTVSRTHSTSRSGLDSVMEKFYNNESISSLKETASKLIFCVHEEDIAKQYELQSYPGVSKCKVDHLQKIQQFVSFIDAAALSNSKS